MYVIHIKCVIFTCFLFGEKNFFLISGCTLHYAHQLIRESCEEIRSQQQTHMNRSEQTREKNDEWCRHVPFFHVPQTELYSLDKCFSPSRSLARSLPVCMPFFSFSLYFSSILYFIEYTLYNIHIEYVIPSNKWNDICMNACTYMNIGTIQRCLHTHSSIETNTDSVPISQTKTPC